MKKCLICLSEIQDRINCPLCEEPDIVVLLRDYSAGNEMHYAARAADYIEHLRANLDKCVSDRDAAWDAFNRLRKAYAMVRYPTLNEEIKLLYDTADAVAAGKEQP